MNFAKIFTWNGITQPTPPLCYPLCRYERPVSLHLIVNNILCLFDEYLKIADLRKEAGHVEESSAIITLFDSFVYCTIIILLLSQLTVLPITSSDVIFRAYWTRLIPLVVDIVMLRHRSNKLFCFSLVALAWCYSFFTFTDIDWAVKRLIISRIFIQQAQCRHFKLSMTTFQKRNDVFNKNLNHFRSLSEMCPSIAAKWPPGMNWTFWFSSIPCDNNNHTNSNIFRPWPANSAIYFSHLTARQVSSDSLWTSWARSLRIRQRAERIGGYQRWQGEVWRYVTNTKRYFCFYLAIIARLSFY